MLVETPLRHPPVAPATLTPQSTWGTRRSAPTTALPKAKGPGGAGPITHARLNSHDGATGREASRRDRDLTFTYLEALFGKLRGEPLLVATLAYGLAESLSSIRAVRIRDISVFDSSIVVANRIRPIPSALIEDLREFIQERVCGCEMPYSETLFAQGSRHNHEQPGKLQGRGDKGSNIHRFEGISIRDDLLFSESAFRVVEEMSESILSILRERFPGALGEGASRPIHLLLGVLGRLHRMSVACRMLASRRLSSRSHCDLSALDLFDKGPRIVRRRPNGSPDAYYLWRASISRTRW